MTKSEFIAAVAEKSGQSKTVSMAVADAVFTTMEAELLAGREIKIAGFGKFAVKHREARLGKDPRTGEEKTFPAKTLVTFKASKPLKDALNP